jgi:hypothetical protein
MTGSSKNQDTVQDSTSPAHNSLTPAGLSEFRPWYGLRGPHNWQRALKHVVAEKFDPDSYYSALDTATRDLWKYFRCKKSAPPFPADFFTCGIDLKDDYAD